MFNRINALYTSVITTAALKLADHAEHKLDKIQQNEYDAMIAESQAKIGPYKPATIPVQVWA